MALGERARTEGFALAGVDLLPTEDPAAARAAWSGLDADVGVVILTPAAREALADLLPLRPDVVWTTLPG